MSEPLETQLINAFATAWGEAVPGVLGCSSTLTLDSQQEVMGGDVKEALAVARGYPAAFAAQCFGELSGIVLCLFKKDDCEEVQQFMFSATGNVVKSLVSATFAAATTRLEGAATAPITFGEVAHTDLSSATPSPMARLGKVAGEWVWINKFTLNISESLITEMVLLYAPQGTIEALTGAAPPKKAAAKPMAETAMPMNTSAMADTPEMGWPETAPPPAASVMTAAAASGGLNVISSSSKGRNTSPPLDDAARNMERLLDVELEVIVRFGLTHVPLRELVRIGVGSMIELNRQVDEPVELLVNNRPLARGSVVVVDGYYGICITEIGQLEERRLSLTKPS